MTAKRGAGASRPTEAHPPQSDAKTTAAVQQPARDTFLRLEAALQASDHFHHRPATRESRVHHKAKIARAMLATGDGSLADQSVRGWAAPCGPTAAVRLRAGYVGNRLMLLKKSLRNDPATDRQLAEIVFLE